MKGRTRKEWAHAFGVDYQTMTNALHRASPPDRRIPNCLFDEATARSALVKYYADRRMRYLMKAQRIEQRINEIREKVIE